jgi:hypothetical protein
MSYRRAMTAAGAKVLAFAEFGSYEGTWLAEVEYQGTRQLIKGSYGSCPGCDAYEGELGYESHEHPDNDYVSIGDIEDYKADCSTCQDYQTRMTAFGKAYLDAPSDPGLVRKKFEEDSEWDSDAKDVLAWLDSHFPAEVN